MSKPKISVIVTYNSNTNLEECLDSIINQSFSNIEIICISNAAGDEALETAQSFARKDNRIKILTVPIKNDEQYAKRAGLGVADSELVCFLNGDNPVEKDYIKNLYLDMLTTQDVKIEDGKLYRSNYLENMKEIYAVLNQKTEEQIKAEVNKQYAALEAEKEALHKEWDNFYQINGDNIKNNSYELQCRFNQLESLFYEKDAEYKKNLYAIVEERNHHMDEEIHKIYEDISKVYEHIKSEMNLKGVELNSIYESISKNYEYTEELIEGKQKALYDAVNSIEAPITERMEKLEKDLVDRYVSLKRLMDVQLDELRVKINSAGGNSDNKDSSEVLGRAFSDNLDKLYERMNDTNSSFYEEISNLYKEFNEKFNQEKEEYRYQMQELKNSLNEKIELLNQNK
jgi:glycosyltransferase involved in cell wall biosynthesis